VVFWYSNKIIKAVFSASFLRFLLVGALGTALDYGTYFLLSRVFGFWKLYSSLGGSAVGFTNNFLFHRYWTFGGHVKKGAALRQLVRYTIVSISGILGGNALFYIMFHWLGIYDVYARIIMTGIIVFWNYFGNKFWSFRFQQPQKTFSGLTDKKIVKPHNKEIVLSVVIPAYNEEKRIGRTLIEVLNFLSKQKYSSEVIVVDDGSADQTSEVVGRISSGKVPLRLIKLDKNMGKGYAVKTGVLASRGLNILFTDADNSTPITETNKLMLYLSCAPIVIGSRYLKPASVEIRQPVYRIFLSRLGNTVIRWLVTPGIADTQCGFKLFEREAAFKLFPLLTLKRWGFDFELLSLARKFNFPVKEVPVAWYNSEGSRLRPIRAYPKTLLEVFKVKLNHWTGKYNDKNGK